MKTIVITGGYYLIMSNIISKNVDIIRYIPEYNKIVIFFINSSPIMYIPINGKIYENIYY
jgi:hypothetical protein